MNGGDAHQITAVSRDVEQYAWRPDGMQIAYVTADDNPNTTDIEQHNDAFEVGNNDYLATEARVPSHAWSVAADGGPAHRLTSGAWSLPPPDAPPSPLSWSPDGKLLAIVQQATPNRGDDDQRVIATLEVASGKIQRITGRKTLESYPLYSPGNDQIAYLYPRDGDPNNENELFVTSITSGKGIDVTRSLDRDIDGAIWSADSKSLLLGAYDGTRVSLWFQPLGGSAKKLDLGSVNPTSNRSIDVSLGSDGAVALIGSTPRNPYEIYYLPSGGGSVRRLSTFNQEIESRDLGRVEPFTWNGPNGFREDGIIVYPPHFSPQRKYPLVLVLHGGPADASIESFNALAQLLAAHDYVVFSPNYRGSNNLGNAFERAIYNDAGDGPGRDVMAGLKALERRGFIDHARIAVSGWSYGGFMTSWLTGHYHVWKAAVSGAAVNDLVHAYALSDFNVTERYGFGGSPWSGNLMKAYVEQSPIFYARRITTPTLILSNTGDARVPITQSYVMYHALKDNGVPVRFVAYPIAGHFPNDPVRSADVDRRWIEWIDQHLGGQ